MLRFLLPRYWVNKQHLVILQQWLWKNAYDYLQPYFIGQLCHLQKIWQQQQQQQQRQLNNSILKSSEKLTQQQQQQNECFTSSTSLQWNPSNKVRHLRKISFDFNFNWWLEAWLGYGEKRKGLKQQHLCLSSHRVSNWF